MPASEQETADAPGALSASPTAQSSAGLPKLPEKAVSLPSAEPSNVGLLSQGASAEQPASAEAARKRKRLGWGQGLKRRESHPVLGQVRWQRLSYRLCAQPSCSSCYDNIDLFSTLNTLDKVGEADGLGRGFSA